VNLSYTVLSAGYSCQLKKSFMVTSSELQIRCKVKIVIFVWPDSILDILAFSKPHIKARSFWVIFLALRIFFIRLPISFNVSRSVIIKKVKIVFAVTL